jgi:hypothetical protein
MRRAVVLLLGTALGVLPLAGPVLTAAAQTKSAAYKAPRNAFGQPDLAGYWSNASLTPEARPSSLGGRLVYTPEEVAKLESAVVEEVEAGNQATDPNAPPPKAGGETPAAGTRPEFVAAGGNVGGYNRGWLDPGAHVMRVDGQPRTSIITTPNGQPPPRKANAPSAFGGGGGGGGAFDNPETRSLGERCILSFGRNAGPPMLANGFYNNNYQIVQARDHVAIVVEMVHDTRIIPLVANKAAARHRTDGVRPWMGDSVGWWEGDTLVVETTNFPRSMAYRGAWEKLKVTERFTRKGPDRLHYAFTVEDADVWDTAWGGEYEFSPLEGRVMEYACHEGNYALEGILAGAREQERTAGGARNTAAR